MRLNHSRISRAPACLAALLTLALVGGCEQLGPRFGLTGQVAEVPPAPIGPDRLRVSLPKVGAQATLAPVARRNDATVWQTLDGITLTFLAGVLTATRGLGEDLMSSDASGTVRMLAGHLGDAYYPMIRSYLDGEDQTRFPAYQCRRSEETTHQINVGDTAISARRIEEVCVSPDHRFTNIYWLDDARTLMRSRQWVSHTIGHMVTERVMR